MRRPGLAVIARSAAACALVAGAARADAPPASPSASTVAQSLFDEALALMDAGRFDRACPKLEESERLDPGGGTLLNLARCYEGEGRLASAWATYREALGVARRDGRSDRMAFAAERVEALKARVPRVTLRVAAADGAPDVTLDDVKMSAATWDTPQPVDAGAHVVRASAPGRRAFATEVRVAEGELREIVVPLLERAPAAPLAPLAPAARAEPTDAPRASRGRTQRTLGWTAAGVGATAALAGGVFGVLALGDQSSADSLCPGSGPCADPRAVDASARAHAFATVATVGLAAGAALVVGGLVLLLTAPDDAPVARAAALCF